MPSAVLDRVLSIPDFDDRPQMGLSKSGLAAIVERGGLLKDGTKAKASILKRAGIKGDRKVDTPSKVVKGTANVKDLVALKIDGKSVSVPSGSEFVAVKDNHIQSQIVGQRAYRVAPKNGTVDDYIRETPQGQYAPVVTFKTPEQALKYAEKLNKAIAKKQKEAPSTTEKPSSQSTTAKLVSHAVNGGTVSAPNAKGENMEITYNKKGDYKKAHVVVKNTKTGESTKMAMTRNQLDTYLSNLDGAKSVSDRQSTASTTSKPAIAPDTAKKVKRAIAGVKGGKVVKGESPSSKRFEDLKKLPYIKFMEAVGTTKHPSRLAVREIAKREGISKQKAAKYYQSLTDPNRMKQPHLVTKDEYVKSSYSPRTPFSSGYEDSDLAKEDHYNFVESALKQGRKVPDRVLKDYPNLKRTGKKVRKAGTLPKEEEIRRRRNAYYRFND